MSHTDDMQFGLAGDAITALNHINVDTTPATEPLTRWKRVREAVRSYTKADPAPLWEAIAKDDQKAVTKAATEYQVAEAIAAAALADTTRESTFRVDTMSAVKRLILDAQDDARATFNTAADEYTEAFRAAGNHPDPSVLIVTEGGADIWARLIQAAKEMTKASRVLKLAHQFGRKVNDEGSGLIDQVPYVTNLPDIQAVARAKSTDMFQAKEHAPHREWALFLAAGGDLYAGDLGEQRAEVERLIEGAEAGRSQKSIADMKNDAIAEEAALARATRKALQK